MSGRKESPRKVTLAMIKGKPITTSVPAIRYHASDDELEELYPSTDDEKRHTPDPGDLRKSPTKSPPRNTEERAQDDDSIESNQDRSEALLEGTPPSTDPWKVFSEIKGKITKTFEEKLSEMKSEKKKKKKRRSPGRNSSVSDSEDFGDATPSDENVDRQRTNDQPGVTILRKRGTNPARYVGFSKVRTGLMDKTVKEDDDLDCVESGVEAAEYNEEVYESALDQEKHQEVTTESMETLGNKGHHRHRSGQVDATARVSRRPGLVFSRLVYRFVWRSIVQTGIFLWTILCLYWLTPVPSCCLGFGAGVFVTLATWNLVSRVKEILSRPPEDNLLGGEGGGRSVPVLEIPAVEEHAVVERFEGWLNELPYPYDPDDYHVARTRSVFFRLEGNVLRIMETKTKVPKRTVWDEPRHKLKFTRRRVYDLLGAKVELLPQGLIRRRRWSKKYPICVTLRKEALISNIALKYAIDGQRSPFDEKCRRPGPKRKAPRKRRLRKDPDRSRQPESTEKSSSRTKERKPEDDEVGGDDEGDDTDDDLDGEEEEEDDDEEEEEQDLDVELDPFGYEDDLLDDTEEEDVGSRRRKEEEDEADEEEVDEDMAEVEKVEASGMEEVKEEEVEQSSEKETEIRLFIFARADRQKEDWYRRLVNAITETGSGIKKQASSVAIAAEDASHASTVEAKTFVQQGNSATSGTENLPELSYNAYMAKYLDTRWTSTSDTTTTAATGNCEDVLWMNCLIARVLFDMHKSPETITLIQDKIQRKLSNIKLPYFMECLLVSEVTIGQGAPVIRKVGRPVNDERGLWLDLDISYRGSMTMTVETKLNLMKLTRTGSVSSNTGQPLGKDETKTPVRSPIFDSDVEDTPETSTEDEDSKIGDYPATSKETPPAQSSGKKFLSMVDRIAANKYFQHATELSYVRRAMEGVSNTEIRLMVTISGIEGSLSVNIPPAPADRLWYGFRPVPKVTMTVKPALGERTLNIVYVTKWIEAKLLKEFEKLVVLPNMDDLVLPLCPNYPYVRQ